MAAPMEVQFSVQRFPRLSVQWDWKDAFRNEEKAWVSCSSLDQPSVYGYLKPISSGVSSASAQIEGTDGFIVTEVDQRSVTVAYPERCCSTKFIRSSTDYHRIHNKSVQCIDVSGGGTLGVSADDGMVTVWNTENGSVRHQLSGHLSDVNCCRFFPSGEVIVSGGADFQIKIWSAIDGSCPVTLTGHRGGVTDVSIIDKGRNIVSSSRDGTARLWDCGQSKCLAVLYKCDCPINACAVGAVPGTDVGVVNGERSDRELGTAGKMLLLAREDCVLAGVGLLSRQKVFQFQTQSACNCCAFVSEFEVCTGTDTGEILIVDIRNPSSPVALFQRSKSPILSILPFGKGGLLASAGDGTCFQWKYDTQTADPYSTWELTGPDCDPVYQVCARENAVYTACRDKAIRKYILSAQEMS